MPNFNGRGPKGEGPRTGRGRGKCAPQGSKQGNGQGSGQKNDNN